MIDILSEKGNIFYLGMWRDFNSMESATGSHRNQKIEVVLRLNEIDAHKEEVGTDT
jgi:hypothetical protein